ncbi:fluoride efflux transporter FluC [Jonesia quinghaiensis]|uniref:fluoride efflux transporter FluC n=1 Tax=Jonesia quinghaiensis TaxID=262806 RepID=UPI000414BBEE|nr:CrcB family protein [Jonesia quinghaiensis]
MSTPFQRRLLIPRRPLNRPLYRQPRILACIIAGGALGTTARHLIETRWGAAPGEFPWATFSINITGSFLLGVLLTVLSLAGPDTGLRRTVRVTVGTGVLGGFTTYSTFILEANTLARGGELGLAAMYTASSVALGICAATLGFLAARAMWLRHPARTPKTTQIVGE